MSKPSLEYLKTRISVDVAQGSVYWIDATKHHRNLIGKQAGSVRKGHHGKHRWVVKVDGIGYPRAHLVYLFTFGEWCTDQVDHINGDSLDDRSENLRKATGTENAWNHKKRARRIDLPMGVRNMSGRYQARIAYNKKMIHLGSFDTPEQASAIYQQKRKEYFGEYA